ncbi:MAG: YihY/virulence factor BrkB family protein [Thermoanaerobaculia bacterium]|nr:YihY/virulence factor BrkB family protein [Thermoanaerobaculia bacterium]
MADESRSDGTGIGPPGELIRQVLREAIEDRITAEAARAAYYFFLSLFPLLLAIFSLTGIFGGDQAFEWIVAHLRAALPGDAALYLEQFVRDVTGESRPGILSFSILFIFWSASNVFVAVTEGLNRMYDLEETRSWWFRRLLALVAVIAAAILLVGGSASLLAGPELLELLGLATVWSILRWPLAVILLVLLMWLVYYLLPDRDQGGSAGPTLLGAGIGTSLWLLATWGFRVYVSHFGSYSETYGFVGGIIVLMLWLYLTAMTILFGGEIAATVEQRATDGWEVGQPPPNVHD